MREEKIGLALFRPLKGGFFVDYITARYRVPWDDGLAKKAEAIAVGMTVGSWTDLPDARKPALARYLGEVGTIRREGETGVFEIRYPRDNVRASLSSLLTVVFGKLSLDGRIRLESLDLPQSFTDAFRGPGTGISGIREKLGVPHRPLVMSIFKSENGRTLPEFLEAFEEQIAGGVDFVKDDEIFMADHAAPLVDRILAAHDALARREALTGQKGFYIPVLSGSPRDLLTTAEAASRSGAHGFLITAYTLGLDILTDLQDMAPGALLIVHPAFAGGQISTTGYGIHPALYLGLLPRLAGADVVLYPSPYGSVAMAKPDALAVAEALRHPTTHRPVLPGPSAGIHQGILPELFRDFGPDVIVNAGGAIHGHPDGTRAGARILREAVDRFESLTGEVTA